MHHQSQHKCSQLTLQCVNIANSTRKLKVRPLGQKTKFELSVVGKETLVDVALHVVSKVALSQSATLKAHPVAVQQIQLRYHDSNTAASSCRTERLLLSESLREPNSGEA